MIGWSRCADIWSKWFSIWIKFVLPTIIKNVRIVNMCFWEIIPSSFVFIKDYKGYDEANQLAMYWSSQLSEVSKFPVLPKVSMITLWRCSLSLTSSLSWVSRCDLGELGWVGWNSSLNVSFCHCLCLCICLYHRLFVGQVISHPHPDQMSHRSQVSRVALWWCSQNVFVIVFAFVFVIIFLLVRSCLLITLIKCLKGNESLGLLFKGAL